MVQIPHNFVKKRGPRIPTCRLKCYDNIETKVIAVITCLFEQFFLFDKKLNILPILQKNLSNEFVPPYIC